MKTRKTRSEMNRFIGKYMENVEVEKDDGVLLDVVTDGNCLFASILYHFEPSFIGTSNMDDKLHQHEILREGAFNCISDMKLSNGPGVYEGLTRSDFNKVYKTPQIRGGEKIYHYPDNLTLSCMADHFKKHIVIFDDLHEGMVTIIPQKGHTKEQMELLWVSSNEANEANELKEANEANELKEANELNYWVIRRESGNHYRPYVYKDPTIPQLLLDKVINFLNDKMKKANSNDLSELQTVTGVKYYSIEWEEINRTFKSSSTSSSIYKARTKNYNNISNNNTRSKTGSNTSTKTRSKTSAKTRRKSRRESRGETTKTSNIARERRKTGHFPKDVKYCWYGCDDHILVWLYDALVVFIETLGKL